MAEGLVVRLETPLRHLHQHPTGWSLFDNLDHHIGDFAQVLITIPASQAVALIEASQLANGRGERICALLRQASYNPLISVMLGYQPAPQAHPYYALVNTDKSHAISWLAWEHEKAPERVPTHAGLLIAQMAPQYSREHWQTPNDELISDVANRVATLLHEPLAQPIFTDIYRWSQALPAAKADAHLLNALTLPLGSSLLRRCIRRWSRPPRTRTRRSSCPPTHPFSGLSSSTCSTTTGIAKRRYNCRISITISRLLKRKLCPVPY